MGQINLGQVLEGLVETQTDELLRLDVVIEMLINKGYFTKEEFAAAGKTKVEEMKKHAVEQAKQRIIKPDSGIVVVK
jgi:hypothetical protein